MSHPSIEAEKFLLDLSRIYFFCDKRNQLEQNEEINFSFVIRAVRDMAMTPTSI
jgi:hypothetical protein